MNHQDQIRFNELYQRHINELTLQGKSEKTIEMYSRSLRRLSEYFDVCPDTLSTEGLGSGLVVRLSKSRLNNRPDPGSLLVGTHQLNQKRITRFMVFRLITINVVFQLHLDVHIHLPRRGNGHTHMVRLNRTGSQQHIHAKRARMTDIKFQLPALIATKCQAGTVIAFYPDIGTKISTKVVEAFQWRGRMAEFYAWKWIGKHWVISRYL